MDHMVTPSCRKRWPPVVPRARNNNGLPALTPSCSRLLNNAGWRGTVSGGSHSNRNNGHNAARCSMPMHGPHTASLPKSPRQASVSNRGHMFYVGR